MKKLPRLFFERSTLKVAQELIGKILVFGKQKVIITETEAYFGNDPASHASRGQTTRNSPMFGPAGYSYIYLIYGMYFCLNITTEKNGFPAAVLIRGVRALKGDSVFDGPGKLCKALKIDKKQNNLDLCKSPGFYIADSGVKLKFKKTPRIGIKKNTDKKWRFVAI